MNHLNKLYNLCHKLINKDADYRIVENDIDSLEIKNIKNSSYI
jgi:hypothetical protein